MRYLFLAIALLINGCHPVMAADGSACYIITDADARSRCLAEARRDPSMCYAIQDSALRARCLADVRR